MIIANILSDSDKSATQHAGDAVSSNKDGSSQGILGQAQDAIGNAAQSVQDTISGNTNKKV